MTYVASCGCGIEVSQDDSHCPSCGDPIVPTPDLFPLLSAFSVLPSFVQDSLLGGLK